MEINEVSQNNIIVLFKKYCLSWWYLFYLYFYVNSIHVFLMRVFFSDLIFQMLLHFFLNCSPCAMRNAIATSSCSTTILLA